MRSEYASFNVDEKIPLFVDSSPAWGHYHDAPISDVKNLSTDISTGMQEYIFGRNIGADGFGIGTGVIAGIDPDRVLLTGAGIKKYKRNLSKKVVPKKPVSKSPSKEVKSKKVVSKKPVSKATLKEVKPKKVISKKPVSKATLKEVKPKKVVSKKPISKSPSKEVKSKK
jgi:hypothetical protein